MTSSMNDQNDPESSKNPPARQEADLNKTQVIVDLLSIPKDQRNEEWNQKFFENIKMASFSCGNPQITSGPDGFPYFNLFTPEPNKPFESFCIQNLKDDFLLERGIGVALNPREGGVDWVFSYGDIVNLHVNKELFSKIDPILLQDKPDENEKALVSQPSENYLPLPTRTILKKFLQSIGLENPKIMMITRFIKGKEIQGLAFNLFSENFPSAETLDYRLKQLSWFLPRHYGILSVNRSSDLANNFFDL